MKGSTLWGAGAALVYFLYKVQGAALVYYLCEVRGEGGWVGAILVYYLCEVQGAALVCSVVMVRTPSRCWRVTWSRSLRTKPKSCALRLRSEVPYYCCQGDCVVTSLCCVYSAVWWRLTVITRDCCVDCFCGYHFCFYYNLTKWLSFIKSFSFFSDENSSRKECNTSRVSTVIPQCHKWICLIEVSSHVLFTPESSFWISITSRQSWS